MPARLAYANIFASDIDALARFYGEVLGFAEIESHRSPIYRCLDAGGVELGFNAPPARDLLGVADRLATGPVVGRVYLTFELASADAVHQAAARAEALGGAIVKPAYLTYYNACQAVLADPEANLLRLNHRLGPRQPAGELANPPWISDP